MSCSRAAGRADIGAPRRPDVSVDMVLISSSNAGDVILDEHLQRRHHFVDALAVEILEIAGYENAVDEILDVLRCSPCSILRFQRGGKIIRKLIDLFRRAARIFCVACSVPSVTARSSLAMRRSSEAPQPRHVAIAGAVAAGEPAGDEMELAGEPSGRGAAPRSGHISGRDAADVGAANDRAQCGKFLQDLRSARSFGMAKRSFRAVTAANAGRSGSLRSGRLCVRRAHLLCQLRSTSQSAAVRWSLGIYRLNTAFTRRRGR